MKPLPELDPQHLVIYADGASKGNPGPSGWGAVVVIPHQQVIELGGAHLRATNNQMEMMAIMQALRLVASLPGALQICSDSSYVLTGIQQWVPQWQRSNWHTKEGKPVANLTLWQHFAALVAHKSKTSHISWIHIPGHAGIAGNERADAIASGFASNSPVSLYQGPLLSYGFDPYSLQIHSRKLASKKAKGQKAYSYLSQVEGVLARHRSWDECQARTSGKSGAKFKKTLNQADEEATIRLWQKS